MTSDQRLDQLEPLISQTLAVADRHTAQLRQIANVVIQQSDNMEFALRELHEVKQEVSGLKRELSVLNEGQAMTNLRLGVMENSVSVVDAKVTNLDSKLDRLLNLLSGNK